VTLLPAVFFLNVDGEGFRFWLDERYYPRLSLAQRAVVAGTARFLWHLAWRTMSVGTDEVLQASDAWDNWAQGAGEYAPFAQKGA
jgi:hypothetical protein